MKKNIKLIMILMSIIFFVTSCKVLENKTIKITKSMVQKRAEKKFPITRDFKLGNLSLNNPKIDMFDERVYVTVDYDLSFLLSNVRNKGQIYMSSKIEYNTITENAYFTDFRIEKILGEDGEEIGKNIKEVSIIKNIISSIVEKEPVYEYKKEEIKSNVKIKKMFIKDGKFYIQT